MNENSKTFIELALKMNVLCFGDFTLKSGRQSPYFFNAGLFNTGSALLAMARCYAHAIEASGVQFDMIFGPAYKGIPLAASLVTVYANDYGRDIPVAFNRKEAKAHGEGGSLIGAPIEGKVLIVDDVLSAGTAVRQSIDMLQAEKANVAAVCVGLDREEKGKTELSASAEIQNDYDLAFIHVASLGDLLQFASNQPELEIYREKIVTYRKLYAAQT